MKFSFKESYRTPYFSIEEGTDPDNISPPYYRLTTGESAICCVLNSDGEFIMVEQYRPNINSITLELPAGNIKSGEPPILAATREFNEETGMTCTFLPLGSFHLMMNRVNSKEHIFFGFNPRISDTIEPEPGIKVRRISRDNLQVLIKKGNYKQIAGLGVMQMASLELGLDILNSPIEDISREFSLRIR